MQIVVNYAYISMRFVLVPTMKRSKAKVFDREVYGNGGLRERRARFLSTVGGKNFQKGLDVITSLA